MKSRTKFLLTCMTGALLIGAGPMLPEARAADSEMPTKAMPAAEPVPFWWFHGYVEAGGRFFLNNPQNGGIAAQGGRSLGKFYEYRDLRPGPFGNFHLATGTSNGLYQVDVWGKNVGYDDQRFDLRASKAGEQYFNFQWDETPHNYGTGHTIFDGVGSTALTVPTALATQLATDCGGGRYCANPTAAAQHINQSLHDVDMGIRRDTAAVDWRWTPTTAWDIKADYSNMHRTGTQTDGIALGYSTRGVRVDAPKPVDDTTQNFGVNGEYQGTSPWGKLFTLKVAYNGSIYSDASDSYTVQNPFCVPGSATCTAGSGGVPSAPVGLVSLWPSNQANGFSATLGADLPYIMMRQNENFLPFAYNSTAALPASSLNGAINTLLSNNVLTTQITPELKSKLSYRYYNYGNDTPEILVPTWIGADITPVTNPVHAISISYTKQNAGADLNWRPINEVNLGAAYGYERYDWNRADVDVTNENSGKVYGDWKPFTWLTARASWMYSTRRYDNYDYLDYVGNFLWPTGAHLYSTAYRQFYLDNRDRNKARFSVSVDVLRNLTVTPTFGLQNDDFKLNQTTEEGLLHDNAWNAGVDVAYAMTPATRFLFSYVYEHRSQLVGSAGTSTPPFTAANYYTADVEDKVNTFIIAVDHALIPDKLDLHLGYTTSLAVNSQPLYFGTGAGPSTAAGSGGQYPDVKSTFQRLEAIAKYTFDEDVVRRLGWNGKVFAKLGYAWERSAVDNWQIDSIQPYVGNFANSLCWSTSSGGGNSCGYMTWLANDNPNYNVQMITVSLTFKW